LKRSLEMFPINIAPDSPSGWNTLQERYSSRATKWLCEVFSAYGAFEWLTYAYVAWLTVITAVFHRDVVRPARDLSIQAVIALGIAQLAWAEKRWRNSLLHFARHWYPLPLYVFFFEELQGLVHAVFHGWFDSYLVVFDHSLFSVHPSVWLGQFANPTLNDFMQFSYMTYFLYLVILPALLYANRQYAAFWTVMCSTALAHYCVYVVAVLLPVESPFYSLAALNKTALSGGYCTALIGLIEHFGRVRGGAFPSAHVAGSMVAILASWRYRRWLFWLCVPFFISMCVATVYGRYHYCADVFAGMIVGAIAFRIGSALPVRTQGQSGPNPDRKCRGSQSKAALRRFSRAGANSRMTRDSQSKIRTDIATRRESIQRRSGDIPRQARSSSCYKRLVGFGPETMPA